LIVEPKGLETSVGEDLDLAGAAVVRLSSFAAAMPSETRGTLSLRAQALERLIHGGAAGAVGEIARCPNSGEVAADAVK
jgi:hypothetical protein